MGGIATIGGSGRRVVGVSRAYGSNSPRLEPGVCIVRGVVVVLAWGSWRAAMRAWCGGGRLGLTGGLLGPFLRTLTRLVAVWARRPHCHLKGPAVNRRASSATYGAELRRRGGITTIGGSGRRVVGVSRAYGSNSPRLEPCCRRGSFDNEAQQSQFPRLEPGRHHLSGRHAPMHRRPRRSPRSAHCYVSETLPVHTQEWPYRACA